MRNIFILIRRFSVLLLFLTLQIICISALVRYSKSHRARYMEISYELTGRINKKYNNFTRYFSLAQNNRQLAEENTRLANLLAQNFTSIDSAATIRLDTLVVDSSNLIRKYIWRDARVINNSVGSQTNYITLERGRKQGIARDMAVVGAGGIVGIVTDVSDNMCVAMSLLNTKNNTSVMLQHNKITGILEWDGENPEILQIKGIPKSAEVKIGDTVLTSNLSMNYPSKLMVGIVTKVLIEEESSNYLLMVKPGTNFFTIDFVSIVENLFLKEQEELQNRIRN